MSCRLELKKRLESAGDDVVISRLRASLGQEETEVLPGRVKVTVEDTLRPWTVRWQNTQVTQKRRLGAEQLLSSLQGLGGKRKLEQIALVGPRLTGNLFIDSSRHLVGRRAGR